MLLFLQDFSQPENAAETSRNERRFASAPLLHETLRAYALRSAPDTVSCFMAALALPVHASGSMVI